MARATPTAGAHYPRSLGEFSSWFGTDADCLDYLEWLRWPDGFVCTACAHEGGWRLGDGRWMCPACNARTSPTAGTIFDRTRTPLTVWFMACWLFATQKDGISALGLQSFGFDTVADMINDANEDSHGRGVIFDIGFRCREVPFLPDPCFPAVWANPR